MVRRLSGAYAECSERGARIIDPIMKPLIYAMGDD